jgi:outer membrane protein OmpA-like peptidoglycan-associated protein
MQGAVTEATNEGSPVGVVDLDGSPRLTLGVRFSDPSAGNPDALSADKQTFMSDVAESIMQTRASSPHADVLDALEIAARAIRAACSHGGTIFLEDSGLQETGPMSFRQPGLLTAAPQDVASFLARGHELPALLGIAVWLVGIGDTAPPQHRLSISQQNDLIAIWAAIARAGRAAAVRIDRTPRTGRAPVQVPAVLLVSVPPPPHWVPGRGNLDHVFPDSGPLGFLPNVAVFRDRAAAVGALRSLAAYLRINPATRILLTGTTARWGSFDGDLVLSRRRAEKVKLVLVQMGVSPRQIETNGVGWRFPGYINDQASGGGLLPGPAEHNRSVIVTEL